MPSDLDAYLRRIYEAAKDAPDTELGQRVFSQIAEIVNEAAKEDEEKRIDTETVGY